MNLNTEYALRETNVLFSNTVFHVNLLTKNVKNIAGYLLDAKETANFVMENIKRKKWIGEKGESIDYQTVKIELLIISNKLNEIAEIGKSYLKPDFAYDEYYHREIHQISKELVDQYAKEIFKEVHQAALLFILAVNDPQSASIIKQLPKDINDQITKTYLDIFSEFTPAFLN